MTSRSGIKQHHFFFTSNGERPWTVVHHFMAFSLRLQRFYWNISRLVMQYNLPTSQWCILMLKMLKLFFSPQKKVRWWCRHCSLQTSFGFKSPANFRPSERCCETHQESESGYMSLLHFLNIKQIDELVEHMLGIRINKLYLLFLHLWKLRTIRICFVVFFCIHQPVFLSDCFSIVNSWFIHNIHKF